ncbi:hypothetical protein LWI29_022492 [Acer saccharum]|uniref:Retrovirus-related Pol polyprotein from transposon TNT 1-94 n=1 Tax=Acer saccharum TaxID=4024 RepID=A0AA39VEH8_ACESA|nr:hypothetical protein LWI29_022492 [Acer saccharum]
MRNCKPTNIPLCANFLLSDALSPRSLEESRYMENIPYSSAVGSMMYAMISTRPDLAQVISVLSRYMANPRKGHWNAMKWRYINFTNSVGLNYDCSSSVLDLVGALFAMDEDPSMMELISIADEFFIFNGAPSQMNNSSAMEMSSIANGV